eukprot:775743-Pyramimonas_sp.AAC.1
MQMGEQARARITQDTIDSDHPFETDPSTSAAKWFAGPMFERCGETREVFLEATRIEGMECLLIDPGARDNLVGDRQAERRGKLATDAKLKPIQTEMEKAMGVE